MKEKRLFAQTAIALLFISIFTALPVVTATVMVSTGEVEAIPLWDDSETNSDYPPGQTFTDFVGGVVAFDLDMIDVEQIAHPQNKWYGKGVVVAVLDTGLLPFWEYFFPRNRIITELGIGFKQDLVTGEMYTIPWDDPSTVNGHGTHVTSTIIGYSFQGRPITGVAPLAKIIPVKVLSFHEPDGRAWGTSAMVAAGIDYVTSLVTSGMFEPGKVIINMSLGANVPMPDVEAAVDRAIAAGVIVVASAGNRGNSGMGYPGGHPQVISAAWAGWTGQWYPRDPITGRENRGFWLNDVPENLMTPAPLSTIWGAYAGTQVYMSASSSRSRPDILPGQDLDVSAPGSWALGPYWTPVWGPLPSDPSTAYAYVSGTSMASPHVAGTAALIAEKRGAKLTQSQMETLLENTAERPPLTFANAAGPPPWNPYSPLLPYMAIYISVGPTGYYWTRWGDTSTGHYNTVGAGLLQTDAAVKAVGG